MALDEVPVSVDPVGGVHHLHGPVADGHPWVVHDDPARVLLDLHGVAVGHRNTKRVMLSLHFLYLKRFCVNNRKDSILYIAMDRADDNVPVLIETSKTMKRLKIFTAVSKQ